MAEVASGKATAPFGSWQSPFAIESLTTGRVSLGDLRWDGDAITWLEGRPEDGGRATLVRWTATDGAHDISPPGLNVRDRVHEYGGAPYVTRGDLVIVSDFATGRLHRVAADRTSEPITPDGPFRYADLTLDPTRDRLLAVCEDHSEGLAEAQNTLVAIALDGSGRVSVLAEGRDFYAAPLPSPDGTRLAFLAWDHPNLPWDGTELQVATLGADGELLAVDRVAGSGGEWVAQPRWSPDGHLHFVAETTGWMNLYRLSDGAAIPLAPMAAEFAYPDWLFGFSNYDFADDGRILAIGRSGGRDRLFVIGPEPGQVIPIDRPWTDLHDLRAAGHRAVFVGAAPDSFAAIIRFDLDTLEHAELRRSSPIEVDPRDISIAEPIEFPTSAGRTAFGLYYPPVNRRFEGPPGEKPPLIVTSHGGPTAAAYNGLGFSVQLFTSRGYAVLDVDYGGSTGYGREYRKRLEGEWGIVDVEDCINGARYLVDRGDVDGERLAIRGASSSGYTTLAALAFHDVFRAGASYFGIGNLEALQAEGHKFESRYSERLVGPWPEGRALYRERSPVFSADRITAPVLVLQGLDDRIVPPSEAERIVKALLERRIPHAYLAFEGEDHGFRKAENIIRSAQAEFSFYGQVFGFRPADAMEPLAIEGLEEWRAARSRR
ncbi:MAG TPA: S9 family peptidase [Candidatus Limnocylindrales bacterium]